MHFARQLHANSVHFSMQLDTASQKHGNEWTGEVYILSDTFRQHVWPKETALFSCVLPPLILIKTELNVSHVGMYTYHFLCDIQCNWFNQETNMFFWCSWLLTTCVFNERHPNLMYLCVRPHAVGVTKRTEKSIVKVWWLSALLGPAESKPPLRPTLTVVR